MPRFAYSLVHSRKAVRVHSRKAVPVHNNEVLACCCRIHRHHLALTLTRALWVQTCLLHSSKMPTVRVPVHTFEGDVGVCQTTNPPAGFTMMSSKCEEYMHDLTHVSTGDMCCLADSQSGCVRRSSRSGAQTECSSRSSRCGGSACKSKL